MGVRIKKTDADSAKLAERPDIDWDYFKKLCALQCSLDEITFGLMATAEQLDAACMKKHGIKLQGFIETYRQAGLIALRRKQWASAAKGGPQMLKHLGEHWLNQKSELNIKTSGRSEKDYTEEELENLLRAMPLNDEK